MVANNRALSMQTAAAGGTGAASPFAASGANMPDPGQRPDSGGHHALTNLNLARSLAEPNLVTLNGRPARFQAGGQFPVPVVTGFTAAGLSGVQFVPFGVQLEFKPVITDKDCIRLVVNGDISTRDLQGSANVNGTNVPASTRVSSRPPWKSARGNSVAMAGLIQNNYGATGPGYRFLVTFRSWDA